MDANLVEADVLFPDGTYMEGINFDFTSLCGSKTKAYGFSDALQYAVIFHPFHRKAVRPEYKGWISMMEVNNLACELEETQKTLVKEISKLAKQAK